MRSPCKGDTLLVVVYLSGESKVCDFDLFVFDENISWFDITMKKVFTGEVNTTGDDLLCKG